MQLGVAGPALTVPAQGDSTALRRNVHGSFDNALSQVADEIKPTSIAQTVRRENGQSVSRPSHRVVHDTLHSKLPTITVKARRAIQLRSLVQSSLGTLDSAELHSQKAAQVVDVLSMLPGVYVRDYGGLGGLKTVSLRGASAAQTAVQLDGVRLNATQNSVFDFSILPLSFISSIESNDGTDLLSSPSGAIGGEIVLRTPDPVEQVASKGAGYSNEFSLGSWTDLHLQSQALFKLGTKDALHLACSAQSCKGNYSFDFNNFGETKQFNRENADLRDLHASIAHSHHFEQAELHTRVFLRTTERGAPGSVVQGNIQGSSARLSDEDIFATQQLLLQPSPELALQASWYGRYGHEEYSDTGKTLLGHPFTNRFYSRDAGLQLRSTYSVLGADEISMKLDASTSNLRGDLIRTGVGNSASRVCAGVSFGYKSPAYDISDNIDIRFVTTLRCDASSDASPQWTPRSGFQMRFGPDAVLRVLFSTAYRLPSFNELYYQNYGSTNIQPEQSRKSSLSFEENLIANDVLRLDVSVSAYYMLTDNQIVAIPRSPLSWSAANMEKVSSVGADLGIALQLDSTLRVRAGISQQEVRNALRSSPQYSMILPYTPTQLCFVSTSYSMKPISFSASAQWSSSRYTQTDNAPESVLPAQWLLSSSLSTTFSLDGAAALCYLRCDNLLNTQYVIVANFPMPGRQFHLGLSVSVK